MYHRYIYWVYHLLGITTFTTLGPKRQQQISNLICKNIQSKTKKENQILPAAIEKLTFLPIKKAVYDMVPLDKEL